LLPSLSELHIDRIELNDLYSNYLVDELADSLDSKMGDLLKLQLYTVYEGMGQDRINQRR